MPRLIVTSKAIDDLVRVRDFLASKSPEAAARARKVILEHFERARKNPMIYRPVHNRPDEREIVIAFGSYGYVARFRHDPENDAVVILRVWHQREQR
jgi:plasmid stabilization system protein ParE